MIGLLLASSVFLSVAACIFAVWLGRQTHRALSFQVLVVANYIAMNFVSGIVHMLELGSQRGFFDAMRSLEPYQLGRVVLIQAVGLIGLCGGLLTSGPSPEGQSTGETRRLSRFEQAWLPLVVAIILPISLVASLRISEYARGLEVFGGRIISVAGGMARYAFLSHWLVWAVSFAVIWLTYGPFRQSARFVLTVTIAGLIVIIGSLAWNGGRSIVLVFTLPLILVVLPLLRKNKLMAVVSVGGGALAILLYLVQKTSQRSASLHQGAGNYADWIDWQWGRFSMIGFGVDYVDRNGYLFGETILNSFARAVGFLFGDSIESRSATEIAGGEIFNRSAAQFLAPGFSFELYVNLGWLGIFFGYFLVGWACKKIDHCFSVSNSPVKQLFWAYLGTLVVFRLLPSEPGALVQGLLYSATPLIAVSFVSYLEDQRRPKSTKSSEKQQEVPI